MSPLLTSVDTSHLLKPQILFSQTSLHSSHSFSPANPDRQFKFNRLILQSPRSYLRRRCPITACYASASASAAAESEINMVKNKQGTYTARQNKVVVLWDLDNKPPRGPPYNAALALKEMAENFGEVIEMSAYANRHAFVHLPQWVVEDRREKRQQDILERKGIVSSTEPYVCGVCGRKCKTNLDLKKHFRQLHERERQKKVNRMKSLKGKKRQKYKERFVSGNEKYNNEARRLLTPKVGYGLAAELRRAGVYVKMVEDKPQAADWAVKKQIEHSMSRGVDWVVLVSDDSDFRGILMRARESSLGTVVVGDRDRALGKHADLWVPWIGVENGDVSEQDLVPKRRTSEDSDLDSDDEFECDSVSHFAEEDVGYYEWSDVGTVVEELTGRRRISIFSEEEEEEDGDYELWDSDDEDDSFLHHI